MIQNGTKEICKNVIKENKSDMYQNARRQKVEHCEFN
jgi:hypothetical protein